jgi:hypothetical protein
MYRSLPNPDCVVKVGDGRGFCVELRVKHPHFRRLISHRVIVTAAHCLPNLPPAHPGAYTEERTFTKLVGTLDGSKKDIWTECLFADPVADIAVLGCPDGQEFYEQAEAYDALMESAPIVRVGSARSGTGYILSLQGKWKPTELKLHHTIRGNGLSSGPTIPGQSGSPILNATGHAVAVVSIACETTNSKGQRENREAGPQPILKEQLPVWMMHR